MTAPQQDPQETEQQEATGETGALAAASERTTDTDPLAPLNAVTGADDD